jgi:glyoxylase-like metal-dependent hydrolase (beta-lactamase superfamily II)
MTYHVFVSEIHPIVTEDLPPDTKRRTWSAISATLISGRRDAVLVDPLMTIEDGRALADWVAGTGKSLTTIYATHGHGDHFFGAGIVRERFPDARFVATPAVIRKMRQQLAPEFVGSFWKALFPAQIPDDLVVAEPVDGGAIQLEGQDLVVVPLGHTDTDDTTCLYVPSIGLVVAGDAVYNDVHLYLAESTSASRREWIAALDTIESLRPRAVVAGHKRPERDDDPRIIEETRQYIRDFDRIAETAETALELYERMLALHGQRLNSGVLWWSARALKG